MMACGAGCPCSRRCNCAAAFARCAGDARVVSRCCAGDARSGAASAAPLGNVK